MHCKLFAAVAGVVMAPLTVAAQDEGAAAADQASPADLSVAQPDTAIAAAVAAVEAAAAIAPVSPRTIVVPRLTDLVIELMATLSSETSTAGDRFPIRLVEPVMINGETVIPAGTPGEGEVIHAKAKGGMGAAGELIITARSLDLGSQRIPLRSLRVNGDGQSRIDTVNAIGVASAATIPLASLVGFFITGGAKTVNEGTIATARTAEDIDVLAPDAQAAATAAAGEVIAASPASTEPVEQTENEGSNVEDTSE